MPRYWMGVVCNNEHTRSAVHSWFTAFVPSDWGLPFKADVQEDIDTGRETAMRAYYLKPDGSIREAMRKMSARHVKVTLRVPPAAALKEATRHLARVSPAPSVLEEK